jgi:hypothetical protein
MLVLHALVLLATYDILVFFGSFRRVYATVRRFQVAQTSSAEASIEGVARAINYACIWYPKQAQCLQRSFVATYLLRRRGFPAELVLGASPMPFRAHAWVEINGQVINEKPTNQEQYAVWERC